MRSSKQLVAAARGMRRAIQAMERALPRLLSLSEAAEERRVTLRALRRLLSMGVIRSVLVDGVPMVASERPTRR